MGEWIKCSERMPEELEDVLVTDGRVIEIMYRRFDTWYETSREAGGIYGKVTHWMPLPEPPEV